MKKQTDSNVIGLFVIISKVNESKVGISFNIEFHNVYTELQKKRQQINFQLRECEHFFIKGYVKYIIIYLFNVTLLIKYFKNINFQPQTILSHSAVDKSEFSQTRV